MTFNKKEWNLKNKERVKEYKKEYMRKYHLRNKERIKAYQLKNKERITKYHKEYRLKHKEHRSKQKKEYYLKNIEHYKEYRLKNKEYQKEWSFKNRKSINDYTRNKYRTNINFKLRRICRARIRQALKGINKSASTMELIGCTIDELRSHLESLFEPWMTWENQGLGGWDVEHIKAMDKFDLTYPRQQQECCNWSNLQPMEHIANIKKGNK